MAQEQWQYQKEQDALDRETERAMLAAEYGDTSYLVALGITPSTAEVEAAAKQNPEDTAKYMNFMLGYWDEPGVREYIREMTGLEPERYAEYLMMSEGTEVVYRPTATMGSNSEVPTDRLGYGRLGLNLSSALPVRYGGTVGGGQVTNHLKQ